MNAAKGGARQRARGRVQRAGKIGLALLALFVVGLLSAGALAEVGPLAGLTDSTSSESTTDTTPTDPTPTETTPTESTPSESTPTESTPTESTPTTTAEEPPPTDTSTGTTETTPAPAPPAPYIVTFAAGVSDAAARAVLTDLGATPSSSIRVLRMYFVELTDDQVATLRADGRVRRVEDDKPRDVAAEPNDPGYASQWALPRIGWDEVYGSVTPTGQATVAILDTGVDASDPELDGVVVPGTSILPGGQWDADPNGHGTSMAGIVAAETGNGAGIAGVGYAGVHVMPVTVLDADGTGQDSDIIEGVVYAAEHGADVILMSFSNPGYSESLQAAIDYAWEQGSVLVAATGNDGSSTPTFPAGDRGVIGVASTGAADLPSSFSNSGQDVFLAAPGEGIASIGGNVTGTSASAAVVAGAAALVRASSVSASNGVIVSRLARTADPAGTAAQTGNGRVNLARATTDVSSEAVQPAGAAPVGGGGPYVGPYVAAAAENLEGWGNTSSAWVGTVQGSNSSYKEGQSLPIRYSNTLAAGSTHTLVLKYDFISAGSKHFFDHLTTVDRSIGLTTTQICGVLSGCSGAPSATASIPVDTTNPAGAQFSGQQLRAWNVSSISFVGTTYSLTGGIKSITVNFTVAPGTGNKDVAIAYGLHLARENEWGSGNGAASASGGSQKGYTSLDGQADKNVGVNPNAATAKAQIQGFVYNDVNGNGLLDAGEPGLGGVTVSVSGAASTTAITQSDGSYSFSGLFAGTYSVDYTEPSGFVNTGSPRPRTGIVLTDTTTSTGNTFFAQQRNGVISGKVIDDADGSGTQNGGEGGLANAQVKLFRDTDGTGTLTGPDAQVGSTITTAAAGTFSFSTASVSPAFIGAGTYFVTETNPTGFNSTAAIAGTGANTTATVVSSDQIKVVISAVNSASATATSAGNLFLDTQAPNQAPVAVDDSYSVAEDGTLTVTAPGVLANDTDADGNLLTVGTPRPASSPSHGSLTLNADGSFTYNPAANYNGPDSFTYFANDGTTNSATAATVSITVTAVNDAPVNTVPGTQTTNEDTSKTFSTGNGNALSVSDVDVAETVGGTVRVTLSVAHGSLTLAGTAGLSFTLGDGAADATMTFTGTAAAINTALNGLVYSPASNYHGSDTLTLTTNDQGNTGSGGPLSDTDTVAITVTSVNDAPVCLDRTLTTDEDTPADVAPSCTDVDGDTLTYAIVDQPSHGTASVVSDQLHYAPTANYNGPDSFTYNANDGTVDSNTATVTVTVNAVNDAPVANDDSYSTNEDTTLTKTAAFGVLVNDTDSDSASLTAVLVSGPSHAAVLGFTLNADGSFSYTPATNFNGTDTFTYKANDGSLDSNVATVTITVNAVNDAPVAVDDSATTNEDNHVDIEVSANDTDVDNANSALTVAAGSITGVHGGTAVLQADNRTVRFTPTANANSGNTPGGFGFKYKAYDGGLASANEATVTISVTTVNDAPVAAGDSYTFDEDTTFTLPAPGVLANDTDVDGDTLTAVLDSSVAHGSLTLNANGSFSYTPDANYNGSDSFTYHARDVGLNSNTVTVTFTIAPVNDKPSAADGSASVDEDGSVSVDLGALVSDVETSDANLTYTIVTPPAHGGLIGSGGSRTYTPDADFNGPDSFTYNVTDRGDPDNCGAPSASCAAAKTSDTKTVSITVRPVNDKPSAADGSASVDEDGSVAVDLGALVSDLETADANLTYTIVTPPAHGGVSGSGGSRTYTPDADFNGPDSFTYNVTDRGDPDNCGAPSASCAAAKTSDTKTVSITVRPVNDKPSAAATPSSLTIDEDDSGTNVDLSGTDVETAATGLTFTVTAVPLHGTLMNGLTPVVFGDTFLGSPQTLSYAAAANYNGSDSFKFKVTDTGDPAGCSPVSVSCSAKLDSDELTVPITIKAVNDKPAANDGSASLDEDDPATAIDLRLLVSDVETSDANLTYTIVSGSAHGNLTASAPNGVFNYDSDLNFNGSDSFTYKVTDRGDPDGCSIVVTGCSGPLISDTKTVSITVRPVNDKPSAADGSASVDEEDSASVDLGALVSDVETSDANLTYTIVSGPTHGGLSGSGGSRTYTPDADFNGPDSFTYNVTDRGDPDNCGAPSASCAVAKTSDTKTVSITVRPVNDKPSAAADPTSLTIDEDDSGSNVDVSGSDAETSAANLKFTVTQAPTHGTLKQGATTLATNSTFTGSPKTLVYKPDANFNGSDSFTFKVTDTGDPAGCSPVSFTCSAALESTEVTVPITVRPVNDKPLASDSSATTNEDTPTTIDLGALVSDVETMDGNLTYTIVTGPTHGGLSGAGQSKTYTPDGNYNGPDSFTYKVTDRGDPDNCSGAPSATCSAQLDSDTKTVSITVRPVNDKPNAANGSATLNEDDPPLAIDLRPLVDDVETLDANLTYTIMTSPAHGSLTPAATTGVFTYDSATNYNGADSFTYAVTDRGDPDSCGAPSGTCSAALTSDTKTVSITVNPLNDKPSASASPASPSTPEDTTKTVTLSGSDVETAVANLTFTITQVPANGTLKYGATTLSNGSTLSGSPKNVDYVPNTNFNGSDSFKFKVTDTGDPAGCSGGAPACSAALDSDVVTVPITVTADNDGPVVTNDNATPNQSTQFSDGITNVKVTATDVDNADTSLSLGTVSHVYTPLGGSAQPAATGLPSGLSIALTSSTPGTPSSTPGAFNPPSSKVWTISGRMTVPAGSYVITVPVTDGSAQGSTTLTIVVTKEDASLEYSGDVFKNATNSTTMNLAAVIREAGVAGGPAESPALIGNQLAGRQLNFKVYTFTGSTPIQQCTATITSTGSGTGTAGCTVTLSVSDDPYRVDVYLVDNNYYGAPIESQTLVVQINGTGFVTGGGWLNEPNLGSRSNFGFTVKRLKNGNLQGNSNYIYRKTVGANEIPYSGGFLPAGSYNWQIKSNSWAGGGLTQACTTVAPIKCTATFAGKANIKAVNRLTGVEYSLGGNYQYQVDTDDYSEPGSSPGAGPDRYAIRVWDPSTGTYYQLGSPRTWNPAQLWNTSDPGFGTRLQLSGGNIQIH